jgi:hypothetical protein
MPTPKQCLAVVVIAALSVLSVTSPVAATGPHRHEKAEPVTVTNKSSNPVPVSVQGTPQVIIGNTTPIPVVGIVSGGGGAAPEDGAQFSKQGTTLVMFSAAELGRTGKRFVVDFLTAEAGLTMNDCSLMQVRVDDGDTEYARTVMKLHGNAVGLWGSSHSVKMFVDPGQRILAIPFPGCDATSMMVTVVGHYVDH